MIQNKMIINKKILEDMLNTSGGKIDRDALEKATKSGDASALMGSLSQNDKEKLNQIFFPFLNF